MIGAKSFLLADCAAMQRHLEGLAATVRETSLDLRTAALCSVHELWAKFCLTLGVSQGELITKKTAALTRAAIPPHPENR